MAVQQEKRYLIFLLGGGAYYGLETAFRGYSHWTMAVAGGVCCLFLWDIFYGFEDLSLWHRAALGAVAITLVELTTGIIVNLLLHWQVWDYSKLPYHLLGQVCPFYSLLWFLLAAGLFWGMNKALPS